MAVQVGKKAPDFEAMAYKDGGFDQVRLGDYAGKWVVLFFYPADFTFVCPTELVSLARHYQEMTERDVVVLSASTDTHFVHKMWNEVELSKMVEGGLPFPMLWDKGGEIGTLYGVFDAEAGLDGRGAFLIDPDGVLQSVMITSAGVGRSSKELLRQIRAYQYARAHDNEAVPGDWEEGGKTFDKSLEMVGHVCDVFSE